MKYSTMCSNGRLTIPAELRKRLKIRAGMRVAFVDEGDKIYVEPIDKNFMRRFRGQFGTKRDMLKDLMEEKKRERDL